jgi:Predicted membrane protein (DUF2142)
MSTQGIRNPASSGAPGAHRAHRIRRRNRWPSPSDSSSATDRTAKIEVPGVVWAATAANIAIMALFSVLYPAYWAFDETGHVSRVLAAQHGVVSPTPGATPYVPAVEHTYGDYAAHEAPPFVNFKPLPRNARPTMLQMGGSAGHYVVGAMPNQLGQHPPGYYLLAAGVLDIVPDSQNLSWDQTVGLLRLLDVLILSPLPLLCWALSRRFAAQAVAAAASFSPLLIPALARLGASVNNDDLLIVLVSIFTLLITDVMRGDHRMRTAVAIAACTAAALLVKGFALVLPPVALVAYLIQWRRDGGRIRWRRDRGGFSWQPMLAVAAGSALGGLWWMRNLIVYGAIQPAGLTREQANQVWPRLPAGTSVHPLGFADKASDIFSTDFWGALGLAEPPSLPGAITFIATVAALALLLVPFLAGRRTSRILDRDERARGSRLVELGVLALPTVLILVPLLVHGWADYRRTGQPIGIQGRYLYVGLVGLVAICAAGVDLLIARAPAWLERFLPPIACLLALLIEAAAIWVVLRKLWLPAGTLFTDNAGRLLRAIGAQSPWPGSMTAALVSAAAIACLIAVVISAAESAGERSPAT